jgi:hypothetical protein
MMERGCMGASGCTTLLGSYYAVGVLNTCPTLSCLLTQLVDGFVAQLQLSTQARTGGRTREVSLQSKGR